MLPIGNYEVTIFQSRSGAQPYTEWLERLDVKTRDRVLSKTIRLRHGQFGDCKALGGEVYELRFFFGPGYRVYFGVKNRRLILLLGGGDKSSQRRDIKTARQDWKNYLEDRA